MISFLPPLVSARRSPVVVVHADVGISLSHVIRRLVLLVLPALAVPGRARGGGGVVVVVARGWAVRLWVGVVVTAPSGGPATGDRLWGTRGSQ